MGIFLASVMMCSLWLGVTGDAAAQPATEQTERNKQIVLAFFDALLSEKDFEAAAQHLGPYYRQHNPMAADGVDGLQHFVTFMRQQFPTARVAIKRVFAEGDHVILHSHIVPEPNARGSAVVDIFRLEGGKIVEHWDVIQEIPEKSANSNGMF